MNRKEELERLKKMIDESQESLTNSKNSIDRKNEAAVIKELYAAYKNLEEIGLQEEKDRNEEQIEKEKIEKANEIDRERNKIEQEKVECEKARLSDERTARVVNDQNEYYKIEIERKRNEIEQKRNEEEAKLRKYELYLKAGTALVGVATFVGGCAVAAVATNEGAYDSSVMREVGVIPHKMVEALFRR